MISTGVRAWCHSGQTETKHNRQKLEKFGKGVEAQQVQRKMSSQQDSS